MHQPRTIAVILPATQDYTSRLYEGAIRYAEEHRHITLLDLSYARPARPQLPKARLGFEGALTWLDASDTWVSRLAREGVAVVTTSGDSRGLEIPVVAFDGKATVRLAADHLAALGRRQTAYLGFELRGYPVMQARADYFQALMTARGCSVACFELGADVRPPPRGHAARLSARLAGRLREFLRTLARPAVAWCENDYLGLFVCEEAARLGLRVPQDLAILGCGDFRVAHFCQPPLSTIPQPGQLVGYEAMATLERLLDGHRLRRHRVSLAPPPVICRESTQCDLPRDDQIAKARLLIREHACQGLTVNDLLRTVLMSQPTFTKLFRLIAGHSAAEEIRRVRLARAQAYLRDEHLSIARVAGLCGYNEQSKFCKFFKRGAGVSPAAFRKRQRD